VERGRDGRLIGKRNLEEVADDRCRDITAGLAMSHGRRIVESHIHANYEVRREADKPAILLVIGGAEATGKSAAIGALKDLSAILAGKAGTTISSAASGIEWAS
jgi:hypothetical protein